MFCEPKINKDHFTNHEAHQVLEEDWTDVLKKLDVLELGRRAETVERAQDVDRPQAAGDHSVSFHAPSVHLQPSPAAIQLDSPLAAYTNRRYGCGS